VRIGRSELGGAEMVVVLGREPEPASTELPA
jgi:hypothetical protein